MFPGNLILLTFISVLLQSCLTFSWLTLLTFLWEYLIFFLSFDSIRVAASTLSLHLQRLFRKKILSMKKKQNKKKNQKLQLKKLFSYLIYKFKEIRAKD